MYAISQCFSRCLLTTSLLLAPAAGALAAEAIPAKSLAASRLEPISGSTLNRVILSPKAAKRLDIKTATIAGGIEGSKTAPYSSLLYDVDGSVWVYTNPEPLAYVRHRVVVESVKGDTALLKEGPPAGTVVVVVGAAELFGAESGVGH